MAKWELDQFRGRHKGGKIVVCGCGSSLRGLSRPYDFITIGVNDSGRAFAPHYLLMCNTPKQFKGDRWQWVDRVKPGYTFIVRSHEAEYDQSYLTSRHIVLYNLGTKGSVESNGKSVLHYHNNSTYIACQLALYMGANTVGIIGVDFTANHFWGETGSHGLYPQLESINRTYGQMQAHWAEKGVRFFNLSEQSFLEPIPKISVEEFRSL